MSCILDNTPVILGSQRQCNPDEPNTRGRKAAKTHRAFWFVIPSWSNHVSGGSDGGPSCTSSKRGFQHRTGRPILQTPPHSGGGASHIPASTTHRSFFSKSVSTVRLKSMTMFSGALILLHHYRSNIAHIYHSKI